MLQAIERAEVIDTATSGIIMKKFLAILITVCFGLFFQQNVFADSNPTVTFTGGTSVSNSVAWFPDCDATCFSQYSYLKISVPTPLSSFYSNVRVSMVNTQIFVDSYISLSSSDSYYKLEGNPISIKFSQNTTPPTTFIAELVSELGPQPEPCPEPEPCPDCETPPFVQIVVDAFWKYHVAFAAAVPAILVIFLVYRLIKGRLR